MLNRIFWAYDARDLLKFLPNRPFVTSIITSPPYFNLKDYGTAKQIGFHSRTIDKYLDDLEDVFKQCYELLLENGTMWVISDCLKIDGELRPLPFLIAERLRRLNWVLQDVVVWRKDKTLPFSFHGRFRNLFEHIYVYSKTKQFKFRAHRILERHKDESRLYELNGNEARFLRGWPERYSPLGANPGNVWDIPIPIQGTWNPHRNGNGNNHRIHYCPFPQELVARIVDVSSDPRDVVLDPFAGSGSVAAQAELMGRRFVGVEINAEYKSAYKTTCANFSQSWLKVSSLRLADQADLLEEGELILKLRQIKHASVWGQLIDESLNELRGNKSAPKLPSLLGVITVGAGNRRQLLKELTSSQKPNVLAYPVDVYFIFSNIRQVKLLNNVVDQSLRERALKKYGLTIRRHLIGANQITPASLGVTSDTRLSMYDVKRFYQCVNTITASSLCVRIGEQKKTQSPQTLRFIASDALVAVGQKTNVVEEAAKRFIGKFARESIERLGSAAQAAEFLGMTRGELQRLLERVPATKSLPRFSVAKA